MHPCKMVHRAGGENQTRSTCPASWVLNIGTTRAVLVGIASALGRRSRCKCMSRKLQAHKWSHLKHGPSEEAASCAEALPSQMIGVGFAIVVYVGLFLRLRIGESAIVYCECLYLDLRSWSIDTLVYAHYSRESHMLGAQAASSSSGICSTPTFLTRMRTTIALCLTRLPLVCSALGPTSNLLVLVGTRQFRIA
jgi:hypothetical protein